MANQEMAGDWQAIGILLAILIFAMSVAYLTRRFSNAKLEGQTFVVVVIGVSGVVGLAGLRIGWEAVGFLGACFAIAAVPVGWEYYDRVIQDQIKANKAAEELVNEHTSSAG